MASAQQRIKRWENGLVHWDLTEESRKANEELCHNYGRDPLTFRPETLFVNNQHHRYNEGAWSHGYPATAWLQLGLAYACGIYTAQNQGIIRTGQIFKNFWSHHYFDWIQWGKRSVVFAWAGGLVLGTFLFGNPDTALRRIRTRYEVFMVSAKSDVRANDEMYTIKLNN